MYDYRYQSKAPILLCSIIILLIMVVGCIRENNNFTPDESFKEDLSSNSLHENHRVFVMLDEELNSKIYSPNRNNYVLLKESYYNGSGQWREFPEISAYLNDSDKSFACLNYNPYMFFQYEYVVFWLDDERILLDGNQIYNIQTEMLEEIILPPPLLNQDSLYAVPSPDGDHIAYTDILEKESGDYYLEIYLYDVTEKTWDKVVSIFRKAWPSDFWPCLVWEGNTKICFHMVSDPLVSDNLQNGLTDSDTEYSYCIMTLDILSGALDASCTKWTFASIAPSQSKVLLYSFDSNTNKSEYTIWNFSERRKEFYYEAEKTFDFCWSDSGNLFAHLDSLTNEFIIYNTFEQRDEIRIKVNIDVGEYCRILFIDDYFYIIVNEFDPNSNAIYMVDFEV